MSDPPPASPAPGIRRLLGKVAFAMIAAGLAASLNCSRPQPESAPKDLAMGWRPVLTQSGRGTVQTESFQIDTGQWRIKWSAVADEGSALDAGTLRIGVHSAVSGRLMNVPVEAPDAGSGIAYVAEEPRPFFLSIDSSGLTWSVQVEEGVLGERSRAQ